MRIARIDVSNFRAIQHASLDLDPLTAIIDSNNTGKSAFLKAFDLFFSGAPEVEQDDFHNGDTDTPIEVTISFADLTDEERSLFAENLLDERLTVTRRLLKGNPKESGFYSVEALVNPAFSACRNEDGKRARTEIYKELQQTFEGLASVRSADEIDAQLEAWEQNNPHTLKKMRVGSFRGWKNVATGQIKRKTDFILVPAVRDASEDAGQNRSPVKQLIDTLARQTIENDQNFRTFTAETNEKLRSFTDPANVPALANISKSLTTILQQYYSESNLIATWDPILEFPIQFPSSQVEVLDHGFQSDVGRVGHGLQRAIIITILEFLARQRLASAESADRVYDSPQSDIIVAIEEPEIYQHPIKQRHMAAALSELAVGFSVQTGIRLQLIVATHSPLFVRLPDFNQVRISRRDERVSNKVVTSKLTLSDCSTALAKLHEPERAPLSDASFAAKLHIFTPELSEGFFAKKIVLVEGVSDKAILEAALKVKGRDPISEGLTILSVGGKKVLDKPALIFQTLGIPTYVILDNDKETAKDKNSEIYYNRFMQRLVGIETGQVTDWPDRIYNRLTAWEGNLESYLRQCCGTQLYDQVKLQMMNSFEVDSDDCAKSPVIAAAMLTAFFQRGVWFSDLYSVIDRIDAM